MKEIDELKKELEDALVEKDYWFHRYLKAVENIPLDVMMEKKI